MHISHCADKLREVEMRNVLAYTLVCLDLVEQISALGQLHRYPCPEWVFAVTETVDDVRVLFEVRVEDDLHLDLLRREAALPKGMFFVDELDRDDGFWRIDRYGFADGGVCALTDGFADEPKGKV